VASHKRSKSGESVAALPIGTPAPSQQLSGFIAKYSPGIAALAKAVLAKMRERIPGAVELVYDNYNALAIGFGPGERASEAVFSIALFPRWLSLFFLQGANLRDPENLLQGSGKRVRYIVLKDAGTLDEPAIRTLMAQALETAAVPIDPSGKRRLVIRSVSEKQRPRLPKS
jgi:hypothetical protein